MNQSFPCAPSSGFRVFSALLLSFLLVMMPFVQVAAASRRSEVRVRGRDRTVQTADGSRQETSAAAENVFLNAPIPKPAPAPPLAPSVTATLADDITLAQTKRPGETITYTVTISNGGPDAATGVTFTNDLSGNANLTVVGGCREYAAVGDC